MKTIGRIVLMSLVFVLLLANFSLAYNDNNTNITSEKITPFYIPHDCHEGPGHAECKSSSTVKDCGCELYLIKCCCGKKMSFIEVFCSRHDLN